VRVELCCGRRDVRLTYHFRNKEEPTPGITVQTIRVVARTTFSPNAERCITQSNRTRWFREAFVRIPEEIEIISSDTLDIEDYAETLRFNLFWAVLGTPDDHSERVRDTYSGCATSQVLEASGRWVEEMMWAWMKHNEWFPEPRDETMPGRRTARQRERVRS